MNKQTQIKAKRVLLALATVAALGGCAVVPYDSGYYQQGYVEPTVYVAPAVNFGFYGSSRGGYYGHRQGYGRSHGYRRGHDYGRGHGRGHGRGYYGRH